MYIPVSREFDSLTITKMVYSNQDSNNYIRKFILISPGGLKQNDNFETKSRKSLKPTMHC